MNQPRFSRLSPQTAEALRLAFLQGIFWAAWAVGGYQTIYLQENGFPASQFGLLNAIACITAIFGMTVWSRLSDRMGSVRRVTVLTLTLAAAFFAAMPFLPSGRPYSALLLLCYVPFVNFFRAPTSTFVENLTVRSYTEQKLNYGAVRSMGSLLFGVASVLTAQLLLPAMGVGATFWMSSLAVIPAIVLVLFCREPQSAPHAERSRAGTGELLRNRPLVLLLVFAFFYYLAFAFEANFIPYLMQDKGIDRAHYGVITAIRGLMEVPGLLFIGRLRRRIPTRFLIAAAPVLMGLECVLLGFFAHTLPVFSAIVMLYGLGSGSMIGTVYGYVYDLAPVHLRASAHALLISVSQVAGILGNLVGGVLFDAIHGGPFYVIAGIVMFFSAALFIGSSREKKRPAAP